MSEAPDNLIVLREKTKDERADLARIHAMINKLTRRVENIREEFSQLKKKYGS